MGVMFSGRKQTACEVFLFLLVVVAIPAVVTLLGAPMWEYQVNTRLDKNLGPDHLYVGGNLCDTECQRREQRNPVDLSIIMPAFNELERIPISLDATIAFMQQFAAEERLTYEILVVDDYSTDETAQLVLDYSEDQRLLRALGDPKGENETVEKSIGDGGASATGTPVVCEGADSEDECTAVRETAAAAAKAASSLKSTASPVPAGADIRLLKVRRNRGKGGAIKRGVLVSRGKYVLFADADGATDITYTRKLLETLRHIEINSVKLGGSVGMVVGSRAHLQQKSVAVRKWYRTVLMHGFHFLVKLLCTENVQDTQCGFKMFTKQAAKLLFTKIHLEGWVFDIEIIYLAEQMGIPIAEESVAWREVEGSKLIQSKIDVVTTSLRMARDMLCMRIAYAAELWTVGLTGTNLKHGDKNEAVGQRRGVKTMESSKKM